MKIGLSVRSDWDTDLVLSVAQMADELGFDQLWTNGNIFSRDQFLLLCSIASITKRIELGTAIVEPFSRHPVSLAASAATLSALTKRKINIGIGSSKNWIFESVGLDSSMPVSTCCEAASVVRRLLNGEKISQDGTRFKLKDVKLAIAPESKIKVLIGAEGPKFIQKAGVVSDGLIFPLGPREYNSQVIKSYLDSVASTGRQRDDVSIVAILNMAVSEDTQVANDSIRGQLAETIAHMSPNAFKYLGVEVEEAESYRKDPSQLPDRFIKELAVCGDTDSCVTKLKDLEKQGIDSVYMHNASLYSQFTKEEFERRKKNVREIGEKLIPAIKGRPKIPRS
jgi:5,10-methylenetetrahydromethanopterin reductase